MKFFKIIFWSVLGVLCLCSTVLLGHLFFGGMDEFNTQQKDIEQKVTYLIVSQKEEPKTIQNIAFNTSQCSEDFCTITAIWLDTDEPSTFKYGCFVVDMFKIYEVKCNFL